MSSRCLLCHRLIARGSYCAACGGTSRGWRWSTVIVPAVLRRDGHRCVQCGSTTGPFDVDHILPRAMGGSDTDLRNLRTLCSSANRGNGRCKPRDGGRGENS